MFNKVDFELGEGLLYIINAIGCWHWIKPNSVIPYRQVYALFNNHTFISSSKEVVMHSCDNRKCINPGHLSIGTQKDNMQDRSKKGRFPKHYNTKYKKYPRAVYECT